MYTKDAEFREWLVHVKKIPPDSPNLRELKELFGECLFLIIKSHRRLQHR